MIHNNKPVQNGVKLHPPKFKRILIGTNVDDGVGSTKLDYDDVLSLLWNVLVSLSKPTVGVESSSYNSNSIDPQGRRIFFSSEKKNRSRKTVGNDSAWDVIHMARVMGIVIWRIPPTTSKSSKPRCNNNSSLLINF